MASEFATRWRAAYRVQLRPDFGFDDAAAVAPYLAAIGISHLYLSPIAEAGAGSEHGYDVVDPGRVRDELGGRAGFERLVAAAHEHGLGILLDIVPNHMAIAGPEAHNRWWWDVLAHGQASRHANAFDIAWDDAGDGRLLLPVLDDHLGRVIEAGRIELCRTEHGFEARYESHRLPLDPTTVADLVRAAAALAGDSVLAVLADALATADARKVDRADRAVRDHLAERADVAAMLDELLAEHGSDPARVAHLVARQHWRPARWQVANREIGYRRFFDITELVALRTDLGPVFDAVHQLPIGLARGGEVDGLRIDHPDGLRDPETYLERLAGRLPATPLWVEKVLASGEPLPGSWPVAGTTGYDFLSLVTRLFVDTDGARELQRWFMVETGAPEYPAEARASKHEALTGLLAADVDRVAVIAMRACTDAGWDTSRREMRSLLVELAVEVPVYRTYVRPGHPVAETDRDLFRGAAAGVVQRRPDLERDVVAAIVGFLEHPVTPDEVELTVRFQQLTTTAAAKGIEDTACYRWTPLAALCEVGCEPDAIGVTVDAFHNEMVRVGARWPHTLLDTTTHDTKRSEDVRARLVLLSEDPAGWQADAACLRGEASAARSEPWPDPALELFALQTAVGAWPIDGDRLSAYLQKAAREAKRYTSWLAPDSEYEKAVETWARSLVDHPSMATEVARVAAPLVLPGRVNSLAQLVLKLTCPGMTGVYQGTELWDLSLVDPDNRRPVDFALRRDLLDVAPTDAITRLVDQRDVGAISSAVLRAVLALRARRPDALDGTASYEPLTAGGPAADHVVAFARGDDVITVVPRLVRTLASDGGWRSTSVDLPPGEWLDVLTGRHWSRRLPLAEGLDPMPVAVLERT